jgi:hypothetical protein
VGSARVAVGACIVHLMHVTAPANTERLSRRDAARYLSVAPRTLARWAWQGRGPRYARLGDVRGRTLYSLEDLEAWLETRKQTPTAKPRG